MLMPQRKFTGFTLLEMIVVIVIMGIIAVVGATFLQQGFSVYFTRQNITDANWQGRFALEQMSRKIRVVRSPAGITTAAASNFVFTDINGNSNNYQLSGTTLQYNALPLIDGVNTLTFTYLDRNGIATATLANIRYVVITMNITLNGVNYNLRSAVNLRDLP